MRNMQQIVVVTHNFAGIWQRGEEETNLIISYPGCPGPVIQHVLVLAQSCDNGIYKLISGWTKHLLQQTDSHCILHLPSCSWLLNWVHHYTLHCILTGTIQWSSVWTLILWRRILSLDLCAKVTQFYNGGGNLFNYPHFIYLFTST